MKVETLVLNSADTAVLLRARLGPLRSWPDFLSDCIRGRQDVEGFRLIPCCQRRDRKGLRPHYALKDIEDFVRSVLAADRRAGRVPIRPVSVTIDTATGWRGNRFDANGLPAARAGSFDVRGWHG